MSRLRNWFRYYFVRKKAPLSWIFWGDIMRRESSWQGVYQVSLSAVGEPDADVGFSMGAPGDNCIEIDVYNGAGERIERVCINLSYRNMKKVIAGFNKAASISRKQIRQEQGILKPQGEEDGDG